MKCARLILGLLTLPLLLACGQQTGRFDENSIVLSLGVISDTHIGNGYGSEEKFHNVLTQLVAATEGKLDGVVLAAGMALGALGILAAYLKYPKKDIA